MDIRIPDKTGRGELMAAAFALAESAGEHDLDLLARFAASIAHAVKAERQKRARESEAA